MKKITTLILVFLCTFQAFPQLEDYALVTNNSNSAGFWVTVNRLDGSMGVAPCETGACDLLVTVSSKRREGTSIKLYLQLANGDYHLVLDDRIGNGEKLTVKTNETLKACRFHKNGNYRLYYK